MNIFLKYRSAGPSIGRHPWLFSSAIERIDGAPADGAEVSILKSEDGSFIGKGLFNSKSQIRVRLYSWSDTDTLDADFFKNKIKIAIDLRLKDLGYSKEESFRVIYSESDEFSGLVVDKFGPYLSVQFSSLAIWKFKDAILDELQAQLSPKGIKIRADRAVAEKEGLIIQEEWIGSTPTDSFVIEQEGLQQKVDLRAGQKTGYYLDQRINRERAASYAKGKRVLDLFCYAGAFSLACIRAGAREAVAVDSSAPAIALAKENLALNDINLIRLIEADAFDYLQQNTAEKFDMIILDPPRFASSKKDLEGALRKYYRLNLEALSLLNRGGILVTSSCSGSVRLEDFLDTLATVGRKTKRSIQILEVLGAAPDHPVIASCPETHYLKSVIARVL